MQLEYSLWAPKEMPKKAQNQGWNFSAKTRRKSPKNPPEKEGESHMCSGSHRAATAQEIIGPASSVGRT